jgi:hypothetical protein
VGSEIFLIALPIISMIASDLFSILPFITSFILLCIIFWSIEGPLISTETENSFLLINPLCD